MGPRGVPWPSRGVPWPLYEDHSLELLIISYSYDLGLLFEYNLVSAKLGQHANVVKFALP